MREYLEKHKHHVKQEHSLSCELATLKMVLSYHGILLYH